MSLSNNSRTPAHRIPLLLDCVPVSEGSSFNLTQGLPFADGQLESGAPVRVVDADGTAYPTQGQTLAAWRPDRRHVKWLLIDAQLPGRLLKDSQNTFLEYGPGVETVPPDDPVRIEYFDEDMGRPATMRNEHLCLCFRHMIQDPNPDFLTAMEVNGENGWQDLLSGRSGPVLYAVDGHGHGCDSIAGAPAPRIEVEERGPIRSSVCVRGMHADEDGRYLLPYILRMHLFSGSGRLRMFHTFVFDQNPDRFKLTAIGLRFPLNLGDQLKMAFGGESAPYRAEPWRHATWLQEDDRNYRVEIDGQPCTSGATTRGWARLSGPQGSAMVVLRDAWQEHPKGIALDQDGTMDLQFLPSGAGRILDLEVPWKEGFIHCSAEPARTEEELLNAMAKRPTAGVNFKGYYGSSAMPEGSAEGDMQSVRDAKDFAERHLQGRRFMVGDVDFTGRAIGLSKTHEFWLDVRPEVVDDEAAEQLAALVQTPPIAPPEPEYTCGTGVLRIMHPRDVERFGEVEKGLEAMFDNLLDGPVVADRLYGMIDYGDLLNAHGRAHGYTYRVFKDDPNVKITDLIGWYNNECFDNNYTQWINFLRTGERKYWRLAEAYAEHLEDVDTIHVDPLHPESVGLTHYHNILHWSANPSPSHTQIQGWLTHYFLTGNRRALEVAREAAENSLRRQEPAGMVSNRHGVLRREYTAPMGNLWLFYQTTWEEKYGDCARRSLDIFLEAQLEGGHWPRDIFTGGESGEEFTATEDMKEPRGWLLESHVLYDVYKLTGDARIKRAVLATADALLEDFRVFEPTDQAHLVGDTYMIAAKPPLMWLAFACELSHDPQYLLPIREFLAELPAMAKAWAAFDKWVPLQMVGFMPRYAAVAMATMVKGAPGSTIFVANGDPKCIRPVGLRWTFTTDYVGFGNGPRSLLLGGREIGRGDFHIRAKLAVEYADVVPTFVAGAGGMEGFQSRRISYAATPVRQLSHLVIPTDHFTINQAFEFEAIREGDHLTFKIDGQAFHAATYRGAFFGPVGFTVFPEEGKHPPDRSFKIYDFSVSGATRPIQGWSLSRSWRSSLPEVDIAGEEERIVMIARSTDIIGESYPNTVLMPDGKTMFCVYETYEFNPDWKPGAEFPFYTSHCGPLKKSLDGGRTWSGLLPTHESWETVRNCPTIHRLEDPSGKERLLVMVPYGPEPGMYQSLSLDGGATWSPMRPNGLSCTVPPIRLVPISGGRHLASYHDGEQNGAICTSVTGDGGMTWSEQVVAIRHPDAFPCEPFIIRSPGGMELTMIAREQSRIYNSMLATSRDEGQTWTNIREGPAGLTGDRHLGLYAPDGRLIVVFRDNSVNTPASPPEKISNLVAWVGTYEDLVQGGEGDYRIILLQGSSAYPGLELLPDGTIVATGAMKNYPGDGRSSVISTRFNLEEIDVLLAASGRK